jgi:hypothetical protein
MITSFQTPTGIDRKKNALAWTTLHTFPVYGNASYLYLRYNQSKLTIRHHSATGIPVFRACTPSSTGEYTSFKACFPCNTFQVDSKDDDTDYSSKWRSQRTQAPKTPISTSFCTTQVARNSLPPVTLERKATNLLMSYHLKYGHLPFDRIQQATRQGILPIRIAH